MRICRIYQDDTTLQTEVQADGGEWRPASPRSALGYDSPFKGAWEAEHVRQYGARPGERALPFQPVSVRDFSLSEQHNMDAAHDYARRFIPGELFSISALSAGSGMEINRWLDHGDTLELDLAGVGHITHQIT